MVIVICLTCLVIILTLRQYMPVLPSETVAPWHKDPYLAAACKSSATYAWAVKGETRLHWAALRKSSVALSSDKLHKEVNCWSSIELVLSTRKLNSLINMTYRNGYFSRPKIFTFICTELVLWKKNNGVLETPAPLSTSFEIAIVCFDSMVF